MLSLGIYGIIAAVGVSLCFTIVGMLLRNILLFDAIALGVLIGYGIYERTLIHPGICFVIGAAVFAIMFLLQRTPVGFWIISALITLAYASIITYIVRTYLAMDTVWGYSVFAVAVIIVGLMHLLAKKS